MNEREEFNEELEKLYKSFSKSKVAGTNISFSEYVMLYYNKRQADNMLRIGE